MPRPIKTDHWVRTADGARGRVAYVHEAHALADVQIDNDSARSITLPLGELKRIADPHRKLPPIDGLPDTRPRCQYCDKPFRPIASHEHRPGLIVWTEPSVVRRTFIRWDSYDGLFHSLNCARRFAVAAHLAGYRIKR